MKIKTIGLTLALCFFAGAACFAADAKIFASLPPFVAVRRNSASSRPAVREQMRELVQKGALHFVFAEIAEPRIQGD